MVEIINGKIVIKQSSLVLNPTNPLIYDDYEEVVEDNYPTATYSSFLKRQASPPWGTEETKIFYQAVRQCGLDFTMMQIAFFPHRTRKQLKAKFFREEKTQSELMNRALHTSLPLEISLFEDSHNVVAGTSNIRFTGTFDPNNAQSSESEEVELNQYGNNNISNDNSEVSPSDVVIVPQNAEETTTIDKRKKRNLKPKKAKITKHS